MCICVLWFSFFKKKGVKILNQPKKMKKNHPKKNDSLATQPNGFKPNSFAFLRV